MNTNDLILFIKKISNYENGIVITIKKFTNTFTFKSYFELKQACDLWCSNRDQCIIKYGHISYWDVSEITNMSYLFSNKKFNDDISRWDVSKVKDMCHMFSDTISNVKFMEGTFCDALAFNQPLNNWDVSNVKSLINLFLGAIDFNQPLDKWNVSNVRDMEFMFCGAISFNQNINNWDISNVENMSFMFQNACRFNKPLNKWNLKNVKNKTKMFSECDNFLNYRIGKIDTIISSNLKPSEILNLI